MTTGPCAGYSVATEPARLATTARELYRGHDDTFQALTQAIEVRGGTRAARIEQVEMCLTPGGPSAFG